MLAARKLTRLKLEFQAALIEISPVYQQLGHFTALQALYFNPETEDPTGGPVASQIQHHSCLQCDNATPYALSLLCYSPA